MSHATDKPKFSIELLDQALSNLNRFKPIEKMALRGCIADVLAQYWQYQAEQRPDSSVVQDVKNFLLVEMLSIEDGIDIDRIAKGIRAYNSKVPKEYSLNANTILNVYQELLKFNGKPKTVHS